MGLAENVLVLEYGSAESLRIIRDEAFLKGDYTIKWLEKWLDETK